MQATMNSLTHTHALLHVVPAFVSETFGSSVLTLYLLPKSHTQVWLAPTGLSFTGSTPMARPALGLCLLSAATSSKPGCCGFAP